MYSMFVEYERSVLHSTPKRNNGESCILEHGYAYSYTMEASYGGTNMGSRAFTHFTTDDYEGMGRYVLRVYGIVTL